MAKPTLLLYPGAGSDRDQPSLVAIERELGTSASVERLDFPYRRDGRRAPDRAPKLMAAIRSDLSAIRRRRGPIVMGGRSMGGRITSMVAADVDGGGPVDRVPGAALRADATSVLPVRWRVLCAEVGSLFGPRALDLTVRPRRGEQVSVSLSLPPTTRQVFRTAASLACAP